MDYSDFLTIDVFLVILFLVIIIPAIVKKIRFKKAPEQIEKVKAMAKTSHDYLVRRRNKLTYDSYTTRTEYYVDFQFEDGRRENFYLYLPQYDSIEENEMGMLTYRKVGKKLFFVNFTPTN